MQGLAGAASPGCPAVGAIRWDAWFGDRGVPGRAVEASLGPERWHARLPECARVLAPDRVQIACDTPQQMDREIGQAAAAGIGFWAFVAYPDEDPMSAGLRRYLAAPAAEPPLRFALISEMDKWGGRTLYGPVVDRYVKLMADPRYQRNADGRPLFFLAFVSDPALDQRFGGRKGFADAVADFRERSRRAGAGDPYIVVLERSATRAADWVSSLGLDGVSAYAVGDAQMRRGSFRQLAEIGRRWWAEVTAAGLDLVPPVMTGWDRRPRVEHPVPWESQQPVGEEPMERYFAPPTPAELQEHLAAAIRYAQDHRRPRGAQAVLVYAWNEFDEGGWLAPTLGEGGARLAAVRRAIGVACPG